MKVIDLEEYRKAKRIEKLKDTLRKAAKMQRLLELIKEEKKLSDDSPPKKT